MTIAKDTLTAEYKSTEYMTLEAYLAYDDGSEGHDYELEEGILVEMAPERAINSTIAMFLALYFSRLGVAGYCLAIGHEIQVPGKRASARRPDLVVHSEDSAAAILQDRLLRLDQPAPRLVVEVVSSSDTDKRSRERDYVKKRQNYAERAIAEYWIVHPIAAVILVLTLTGQVYEEQSFTADESLVSAEFPSLQLTAQQVLKAGL